MGILRADRITGLGGANAIKGSVFFGGDGTSGTGKGTSLNIVDANDKADLNFAGNDFTFEAWVFPPSGVQWNTLYSQSWGLQIYIDTSGTGFVKVYVGSNDTGSYAINAATSANGTINADAWNHVAFSRSGNSWTIFTNGTAATSSTSSQSLVSSNADYAIGIFNSIGSGNDAGSYFGFKGYISNLRIRTGAHYLPSTNFTPPVGELQKTSDTVLLACQSPGDITKEATGKTLVPTRKNLNDALPQASHFTPNSPVGFSTTTDVGTQFGSTFDGVTTFDSQAYFVPPGGNTRERNRGRGLLLGGYQATSPAGHVSTIQSIEIQSFGNTQDFGDLTSIRSAVGAVSSKTRAVSCGGGSDTPADYTSVNTCEFVTIANSSNTTDFGDLTVTRTPYKASSNDTRGIIFGGYAHPANLNVIDFITIATAGNATDFGDELNTNGGGGGSCSSLTRGFIAGGGPVNNVISFVTIATTGDAQDFGDLTVEVRGPGGCSNNTRGVFAGGAAPSNGTNVINFITMSSAGNATDFGDLNTTEKIANRGTSNSIRGLFCGGYDGATFVNSISAITIATTGNAVDFGDIIGLLRYPSAVSDSHGGIE